MKALKVKRNLPMTLFVGLFISLTFMQCTDSTDTDLSYLDSLPSNIFTDLVKSDLAPFNKLTKETIIHFNNKLVFSEEGEILGGDHTKVQLELTSDELSSFFNQLYNMDVVILDKMPEVDVDYLESRDCIYFVVAGFYPFPNTGGPSVFCTTGNGYCRGCVGDLDDIQ